MQSRRLSPVEALDIKMGAGHFTAEHAAARGICGHMKATIEPGRSRDGQHVALVHERLRNAILRGEVPAGYTASQAALASRLEVGRTPLREALRMLGRAGLVLFERGGARRGARA